MHPLEFAQKLLEKITAYHNTNRMKADAAAEISHIVKNTYEEIVQLASDASNIAQDVADHNVPKTVEDSVHAVEDVVEAVKKRSSK